MTQDQRFQELAESLPMIVWSADSDGRVDYSNHRFSQYTGVPQREPPASRWQQTLHPEDLDRCLESWSRSIESGEPFDIEYRIRRGDDGAYRWFRVQASPFRDSEGRIAKWYGVGVDIHKNKETESQAAELSRRLIFTMESITDAFITLDIEGRLKFANSHAVKLFGRSQEDLLGQYFWELHPELSDLEIRLAQSHSHEVQVLERFLEKPRLWVEVRVYPSQEGTALLLRDVTERKAQVEDLRKSRERFELLAQATNDVIRDWDLESDKVWWNKGLRSHFGHDLEIVEPGIDSWKTRIHEDDLAQTWSSLCKEMSDGSESWSHEYRFRRADGSYANILDRSLILYDDQNQPVRLIGAMSDVTERKILEEQFLRAQRLESIGVLAGGIAHDLNNILAPILMSVELLQIHENDPESAEFLDIISDSASRGAALVRQVLSFARGVEGRREETRVDFVLKEVVRIIRDTFPREIVIQSEVEPELWRVIGDPTQIHQVLLNLCVNARDALPSGGRIKLSAQNVALDEQYAALVPEASPGRYVTLCVEDNGIGIDPCVRDKIFDPFFTTKELGQGTGLGLSTSLGIVRSHGGYIRVYSEPAKGTQFKVYLPGITLETGEQQVNETKATLRGNGELILVVDDESSIRRVTRRTLESRGYQVLEAENGAEALRAYAQKRDEIAAVITDMMMPVMDGIATIKVLRKLNSELPILAVSGLAKYKDGKIRGLEHQAILNKPYGTQELMKALHELLSRRKR